MKSDSFHKHLTHSFHACMHACEVIRACNALNRLTAEFMELSFEIKFEKLDPR